MDGKEEGGLRNGEEGGGRTVCLSLLKENSFWERAPPPSFPPSFVPPRNKHKEGIYLSHTPNPTHWLSSKGNGCAKEEVGRRREGVIENSPFFFYSLYFLGGSN